MRCKRFDNPCAKPGLGSLVPGRHTNAVILDRHSPVRSVGAVVDHNLTPRMSGKGVFLSIDHEFGNDQAQAHRFVRGDEAVVDSHLN
jgi:hypothetical protein